MIHERKKRPKRTQPAAKRFLTGIPALQHSIAPRRILVARGGALGDFILTLPVLELLRAQWPGARSPSPGSPVACHGEGWRRRPRRSLGEAGLPYGYGAVPLRLGLRSRSYSGVGGSPAPWRGECHLELLAYPRAAELALAGGLADGARSLDDAGTALLFSRVASLPDDLKQWLAGFDLVISYLHDPDGSVESNLKSAGARRVTICSPLVAADIHAIDHLLRPLRRLGLKPPENMAARLVLNESARRAGRALLATYGRRVVVLHPGSGSPKKNWPLERFIELGNRLRDAEQTSAVFALGEAENGLAEQLRQRSGGFPVLKDLPLVKLAAVLSACAGYVGNDSGITQLAAAVGAPVVALFGPTAPGTWAPRGAQVRVIAGPEPTTAGLAAVPVETVFQSIRMILRKNG